MASFEYNMYIKNEFESYWSPFSIMVNSQQTLLMNFSLREKDIKKLNRIGNIWHLPGFGFCTH